MKAHEIRGKQDFILAVYVDRRTVAAADGAQFYSEPIQTLQLGSFVRQQGYKVKAHKHVNLRTPATVYCTQEVLIVIRGRIQVAIYDRDDSLVWVGNIGEGEAVHLIDGGHAVEVLENGTVFYEVKQGPYMGADDKVQLASWDEQMR